MPITIGITESPEGRSAGHDAQWNRTYTRVWQANTSDNRVGPAKVKEAWATATGLTIGSPYSIGTAPDPGADPPVAGDEWHEKDLQAFVNNVQVDPGKDARNWTITVSYGPWQPREQNPLDEPPSIECDGEQFERIVDRDRDGNPIVNSSKDYYDPPVVRDDSRPTMVIVRNEPYSTPNPAPAYNDRVNSATFHGEDPGTVKCGIIKRSRQWHQAVPDGGYYWRTTYPFTLNRDGWQREILDQGLRELVAGTPPERKQIKIKSQLATSPVLLDGSGGVLPTDGAAVYNTHHIYLEADFSALGLE